jgi:hypothetical protein
MLIIYLYERQKHVEFDEMLNLTFCVVLYPILLYKMEGRKIGSFYLCQHLKKYIYKGKKDCWHRLNRLIVTRNM